MIFRSAFVISGMGLGMLFKLVRRHGVSFRGATLFRLTVLSVVALMTSLMAGPAFFYRRWVVKRRHLRQDPIFIVGHWRTGSTFLHELMALDPNSAVPTTLLCTAPPAYPLSRLFIAPFMLLSFRKKRPMDNVRISAFSPQEDEFALFRLTGFSPLAELAFPPEGGRYLTNNSVNFLPDDETTQGNWKKALQLMMRLAQGRKGRRVVLKNPCHTLRIEFLQNMFPEAMFIYIHRNPLQVIPSTRRMWSMLGPQNTLRGKWQDPSLEDVISVYNRLEQGARVQLSSVEENRKVTVSFEALAQDPVAVLMHIYERLGIAVTPALVGRWQKRAEKSRTFKKNHHALTPAEEALIGTMAYPRAD